MDRVRHGGSRVPARDADRGEPARRPRLVVAPALLGVGGEADGERGDADDGGHDRGDGGRGPGALAGGVAGGEPQGQRQPGGQPAHQPDQPGGGGDGAQDDDEGAAGDPELPARMGSLGERRGGAGTDQQQAEQGPAPPAAQDAAAAGQGGRDVAAGGLGGGRERGEHGREPAHDQRAEQLLPAPVVRAEAGTEVFEHGHRYGGDRQTEQRTRGGRGDADEAGLREHRAPDVPRRAAGGGEQGQVATPAPHADRERRAGQQDHLDHDGNDDQQDHGPGGVVVRRHHLLVIGRARCPAAGR